MDIRTCHPKTTRKQIDGSSGIKRNGRTRTAFRNSEAISSGSTLLCYWTPTSWVPGLAVAPLRKLDFHHSSPRCSTLVWLLAEPSCSDDDALHPWVFLCSNCMRPQKQSWRLGCTFQRDRHGKRQIDSHLVYNVLFHLWHQMMYTSKLLGDVRPFTLVFHIGFNQSKLILLPSNIAATTHMKNCSTSSNNIKSFFLNVSMKVFVLVNYGLNDNNIVCI